ncbi:KilA-N domain-containing protein [Pedobacter arcticus]|uniref:KilA-N domain-containing protein n=1 Tax=Pedobacter arcticus TaxID=752140 RepID=UPI0002F7CFE4|nr:KilA-N domain-containing protein [Pedobacter arcticus]
MAIKKKHIEVNGVKITIDFASQSDFISLTDIARFKNLERTDTIIQNWLRNRNTIELLGFWEQLYNPNFKPLEFEGFRKQAGLNSFTLTPKQWIEKTDAIGIVSKAGKFGGTFAHKDIAFEFASWISIEFKLYLIKEFQRLKDDESDRLKLDWNLLSPSRVSRRGPCDIQLNQIAITQMKSLLKSVALKKINPS